MRLIGQLLGTLFLVALVLHWLPWLQTGAAIAVVVWLGLREYQAYRTAAAEQRRLAEIRARADQHHAWVMAGDERGIYRRLTDRNERLSGFAVRRISLYRPAPHEWTAHRFGAYGDGRASRRGAKKGANETPL